MKPTKSQVKRIKAQKAGTYLWCEDRGVCVVGEDGHDRQAIQLLLSPASYSFRERCGKLLVEALNKEIK